MLIFRAYYKWKIYYTNLSDLCNSGGRVSCVAVDTKSGVVAVADDGCQLVLYSQNKVLSNARAEGNMFRIK